MTVRRSATISFTLSEPATVTVLILGSAGSIVKTLVAGMSEPSGSIKLMWDRTDAANKRVRAGDYTVKVRADDPSGEWDTAFAYFPVA